MKPKTSPVWNYFVEIDDSQARCKLCGKVYSRKGRTTTALKSHLKAIHAEDFAEFEKLDIAVKLSSCTKKGKTFDDNESSEYIQNSENEQIEYKYSEGENDDNDDDNTQEDTVKHEEQDPLKAYEISVGEASNTIVEPKKRKIYQLDSASNILKLVRDGEDDVKPILKIEDGPKLRKKAPKPTNEYGTQRDYTYHAGVTAAQPRDGVRDKHEDEFDTFGKHVANQLRKLSTIKYLLAQEEIQSTITKFRMDDING